MDLFALEEIYYAWQKRLYFLFQCKLIKLRCSRRYIVVIADTYYDYLIRWLHNDTLERSQHTIFGCSLWYFVLYGSNKYLPNLFLLFFAKPKLCWNNQ